MLKVLIVEDEKLTRQGLRYTIDWASVNCVVVGEASNGIEALELLKTLDCNIIITDVKMPQMNGIDLIKTLQKTENDYEFIILTAYDKFEYAHSAIKVGVIDFLLKPFDNEQLYDVLRKAHKKIEKKHADTTNMLRFDIDKHSKVKYVEHAIKYIQDNYAHDVTLNEAASSLHISTGHLYRLFKKEIGCSFNTFLTQYRMHIAMNLLKDIDVKIYEVAQKVGYTDTNYFSALFKKIVGINPSEYQARCT
ncbi:MAG: response regulator [Spirochaetales bacterium]